MLLGPWNVEMLGGLRMANGANAVMRFRTQKTASLLAYLALNLHRAHPREVLTEIFWPEAEPTHGRMSLRSSLASLRRQLEPPGTPFGTVLCCGAAAVLLNPEAVATDVGRFETALRDAAQATADTERVQHLAASVALYRGELLPGHYDPWVAEERSRLAQAYLRTLKELVRLLVRLGDTDGAIGYGLRAVQADPYAEDVRRYLIRLYLAMGRPAAALQQYRELESALSEGLGVAPALRTRALVSHLLGGRAPVAVPGPPECSPATGCPPAPVPGGAAPRAWALSQAARAAAPPSLPLRATRFFGREEEMSALQDMLDGQHVRLVTLTGPGGSGKTRLAIELAAQLDGQLEGGAWFCPLADTTSPALIAGAVLDACGLPRMPPADPVEQLGLAFARRPALLVLDNFEQLLCESIASESTSVVRRLMERVPSFAIVVTSRQRLALEGERELPVLPLPVPARPGSPERLLDFPSVRLFVDRARLSRPDFQLTPRNADAVVALCERLEGVPLATELAAAWVQTLTPGQIVDRLSSRFDLLVSRHRDCVPRHLSLHAAIEWSYRLLSPELQRFFARLSVFGGGWTLAAAEAVCEEPRALECLTQLRERSLVSARDTGSEMRYSLLECLREFAREQLWTEERRALARRHAAWYLRMAEEAEPHLACPEQVGWLDRLEADHDNLRTGLDWCVAEGGDPEAALRLAAALGAFWYTRGHAVEGLAWTEKALGLSQDAPPPIRARALFGASMLAVATASTARGRALCEESLRQYGWAADLPATAGVLAFLAGIVRLVGQRDRATRLYEESVALCHDVGDHGERLASALRGLGSHRWSLLQHDEGIALLEESLTVSRQAGDLKGASTALGELGCFSLWRQEYERAAPLLEEHLRLARMIRDVPGTAHALWGLGNLALCEGDDRAAAACLEESVRLLRLAGDAGGLANALYDLGVAARRLGRCDDARAAVTEALERYLACGADHCAHRSMDALAALSLAQGRPEDAALLLGAMDGLRRKAGATLSVPRQQEVEQRAAAARSTLGHKAFARAWGRGAASSPEQIVAHLCSPIRSAAGEASAGAAAHG